MSRREFVYIVFSEIRAKPPVGRRERPDYVPFDGRRLMLPNVRIGIDFSGQNSFKHGWCWSNTLRHGTFTGMFTVNDSVYKVIVYKSKYRNNKKRNKLCSQKKKFNNINH